jgi:8-oxo-dGTP pyrophosphatase MutT (NUDIX family)
MTAAIREVREEAGVEAVVEGLLGVQELPDPHLAESRSSISASTSVAT